MRTNIIKLVIFSFCLLLSLQTLAARYTYEQIPEDSISAINSSGTLVGVYENNSGMATPYIWRKDEASNSYLVEDKKDLPLPSGVTVLNIHVVDINNTLGDDDGETVVGWYEDGVLFQSLMWLKGRDASNEIEYTVNQLSPYKLTAPICTGTNETDYPVPECIHQEDADLIFRALRCKAENIDWQEGEAISVDLDFDPFSGDLPICTKTKPICEFKMAEVPFLVESNQGDDQDSGVLIESFSYILNYDYIRQNCVAADHARLIKLAFECEAENSTWDPDDITPPVIQCDKASRTTGINNENMITGTSIRTTDDTDRPTFWLKTEEVDDDNLPVYRATDLGRKRVAQLQSSSSDTNRSTEQKEQDDINSRTLEDLTIASIQNEGEAFAIQYIVNPDDLNLPEVTLVKNEKGVIQQRFVTTFSEGRTVNIDKYRNAALGFIKQDPEDTVLQPVYWPTISLTDVEDPQHLLSTEIIGRQTDDCPNIIYKEFSGNVTLQSVAGGNVFGWYVDENDNPRPISWVRSLCKDKNEITIEGHDPTEIVTFNEANIGKVLDGNARENIGTTEISIDLPDNEVSLEPRAFFRDISCGIQDINDLLVTPTETITFTEATKLSASDDPSPLIVKGILNDSGDTGTYVLNPEEVFLDLSVSIATDHDRLTVGDEHTLSVTIQNNGAPDENSEDNYATCIKFTVYATVVTDDTLKPTSLKDLEPEKLGGLTFKGYEAVGNTFCVTTPVSITCAVERLNVEQLVTVNIFTEPRPLLADRVVRTSVAVGATESEFLATQENNFDSVKTKVDREACFIATAAYGSYMAPEVQSLRQFRDNFLKQSEWGRVFIHFYYDTSPPIANYIADNEAVKHIARWGLSPLVYGVSYPVPTLFILSGLFAIFLIRKSQRK